MTTFINGVEQTEGSDIVNPNIDGGTIDGTPIGQTTPAAGSFTTLTATTSMTVPTILDGYSTTATAAGTTTLTVNSNYHQLFTGTTTQTVKMPVTSTLVLGQDYRIVNNSTGVVTVTSSGDNSIVAMVAGSECILTCILLTGTTAASWDIKYGGIGSVTGTGGMVLATSPTLVTPNIGVASGTSFQGIVGNVTPAAGTFTQVSNNGSYFIHRTASAGDYAPSALTTDYIIAITNTDAARAVTISTEDEDTGTVDNPRVFVIKDESGGAAAYNITVTLESGGTIDGAASYVINQNYQSITLYVDGTSGFVF